MRIIILLLPALLLFNFACSPKLSSAISNPQEPLNEKAFVLVLGVQDTFQNDGVRIGTIKSTDNGFSTNCSYYEVIDDLKILARQNGANLIKIIEHKTPDQWSTCARITAQIYRVPDFRKHERIINWSDERKLTWKDFKGEPRTISNNNVGAQTYCGFGLQSNYVTLFTKSKIFVKNTFNCYLSWVREDQKHREELLQHEQLHFDLSEVYARKLRKRISAVDLNVFNLNTEAKAIFTQVYNDYLERQELYDLKTNYGLNAEKQAEWELMINKELANLQAYEN